MLKLLVFLHEIPSVQSSIHVHTHVEYELSMQMHPFLYVCTHICEWCTHREAMFSPSGSGNNGYLNVGFGCKLCCWSICGLILFLLAFPSFHRWAGRYPHNYFQIVVLLGLLSSLYPPNYFLLKDYNKFMKLQSVRTTILIVILQIKYHI